MQAEQLSPAQLGYRWPAEWEPHAATWLSWPHNPDTWPGAFDSIPARYAEFVRTLAHFEPVRILVGGADVRSSAERWLDGVSNVELFDIETNDAWCRDHGPIFIRRADEAASESDTPPEDRLAIVDWEYNAWGGKYPPFDKDNRVPGRVAEVLRCPRFAPGIVLEGGAIEGNGVGTILTTTSCLLNSNRNPGVSTARLQRYLADYLSAAKVLWLERGELAGDDTDGHIDQLARFAGPSTIVAAFENDPADDNHRPLKANFEQLQAMTDQDGWSFTVERLPLPKAKFCQGQRLPASYCNFYVVNGGVIVPQFDDPADRQALDILQKLFPRRRVVGVPSLDLVGGLGSFHCLTQQQPA